jgi:hypothetical protein
VSGERQRHELVADLGVGHGARPTSSRAAPEASCRTSASVGVRAPPGGRRSRVEERVDLAAEPDEAAHGDIGSEVLLERPPEVERIHGVRHEATEEVAEPVHRGAVVEAEHGAHDDVERDRLRPLHERERGPDRPRRQRRSVTSRMTSP